MARTIYYTASSADGFIADQHHSLDWLVDTDHDLPEDHPDHYDAFIQAIGALVMGATTYEWVAEHEPTSLEQWPYEQPTWVCTHRDLQLPERGRVETWAGDVAELHPRLVAAAEGKDVWVVGGGDLAGQFLDAGLLDEVHVQYVPVVLGAGAPLLPRRAPLSLLGVRRMGDFVAARYAVQRPPRSG
jgi:dihydrofolate reductase